MKVLIIIDETFFFHPNFLDGLILELLREDKKNSIKVGIVNEIPKKNNINSIFFRYFNYFRYYEIFKILIIYCYRFLMNIFFPYGLKNKNFSVKGVCKKNNIEYFFIKNDINKEIYIKKFKNYSPNLVLSSNSLIFGEEILKLKNIIFLNRHTSLLPSYAGLWPVIRAIMNKEQYIGVSVHMMTSKIDQGNVVTQDRILLKNKILFEIYEESFITSVNTVLKAFISVKYNKINFVQNSFTPSYFSMPKREDIISFINEGGKLI